MPLVDVVERMDLDEEQKISLREIIRKSLLTPESFRGLSDQVLRNLEFPLPAIFDIRRLFDTVLTPESTRRPGTGSGNFSTPSTTPINVSRTKNFEDLTVTELKSMTEQLNLKTKSGLSQLVRITVAGMMNVFSVFFFFFEIARCKIGGII